ncbi:Apolipoprotein L3 [Stylophora pistillata]|uniref:Apolipoprotein L3 n=2 Tax=Stylophora pistillata TaxID=50429 RepID=A0A2B4RWF7_STYPI|nr:Apolipoprotein L3 [Stylophora pistillata]
MAAVKGKAMNTKRLSQLVIIQEKQQDKGDLKVLQEKTEKMNTNAKETAESLRAAAKKLDDVWRDCKTAHAVGTSVGIVGGILSIGGGIAAILTAGVATPLSIAGLCVGGAGATTNLGTAIVEGLINSAEIKKAEKHLDETIESVNEVNRIVQTVLIAKERVRLIYIYYLAKSLKLGSPVVMMILRELVFFSSGTPTKMAVQVAQKVMACAQAASQAGAKAATQSGAQGAGKAAAQSVDDVVQATRQAGAQAADDVVQARARAGSEAVGEVVGKVVIVVNVAFVVWDAIDLGFTIRDLIENKGSEAATFLRQKGDDLENALKE